MEELDLLKKDWKKNEHKFEQLDENAIYKMIHQKSSSVVKWILIISIIELFIGVGLSMISFDVDFLKRIESSGYSKYVDILSILNYLVILFFVFIFFKNYKTISSTDSTKKLMNTILSTRKVVQFYIWYNLVMIALSSLLGTYVAFVMSQKINHATVDISFVVMYCVICTLLIAVFVFLFWMLYRFFYGRLLKKLYSNYNELKKIDL